MSPPLKTPITALATLAAVLLVVAGLTRLPEFELTVGDVTLRSQRGSGHDLPNGAPPAPGPRGLPDPPTPAAVRNVVLMIGDGMGVGQVGAASLLLHGADGGLAVESASVVGLVRTSCADRPVTDSAASATALATGFKADYRALSVLPDGRRARTLVEAAHDAGMATGVVTTSGLADATPAAFLAHVPTRKSFGEVLARILDAPVDVRVGGDWTTYDEAMDDDRYLEVLADAERLVSSGTTVVRDAAALQSSRAPVVALLPPRGPEGAYGPDLAVSTRLALDRLAGDPDGFVLLLECERTDEAGHANDIADSMAAVAELDRAVRAVLEFAAGRDDTLVLVTADHDTGGAAVAGGDLFEDRRTRVRWATHDHTALWVPLFGFGPGADRFGRVLDNTEIALEIGRLLELPDFPSTY